MTENDLQYPERSSQGPLDASEVRDLKPLHDFGAIRIPNRSDIAIRLEVEESTSAVIAVAVDVATSSIQFQAFAAPRGEGLWNEIRESLKQSISSQGGKIEERMGSFGDELVATIGSAGAYASGNTSALETTRHMKFIGIDGPRWFLRILVTGAALTDPNSAGVVDDVIRGIVVNRGDAPMPPRELLPILMPAGAAAAARS